MSDPAAARHESYARWVQVCAVFAALVSAALVLGLAIALSELADGDGDAEEPKAVADAAGSGAEAGPSAASPPAAADALAARAERVSTSVERGQEAEAPPELPPAEPDEPGVAEAESGPEPEPEPEPEPAPEPEEPAEPEGPTEPKQPEQPEAEPAPEASEPEPAGPSPRERRAAMLAERFPAEAAARQDDGPGGDRWALVIGVDDYRRAGVRDTLGSVADAGVLADVLAAGGWRDDHVLVLTDRDATGEMIRAGIEWLADRTDATSRVVVSYSGHLRHRRGVTALWPTDDDYLWADEVGARFAEVAADAMWLSFQGCHAQGLASPALHRDGRLITYSSATAQKSREDPETGHSVQGYYLFVEGLRDGWGNPDAAHPSVQEAFRWAAPRVHRRTAGTQSPQVWDGLGEPFRLAPPE